MPKTNDEILSEYKSEFYERMGPLIVSAAEGKPAKDRSEAEQRADAKFLLETIHIVDSFLANPERPLLQAKLAYDRDDYKGQFNHLEIIDKMVHLTKFFGNWKPGALFV